MLKQLGHAWTLRRLRCQAQKRGTLEKEEQLLEKLKQAAWEREGTGYPWYTCFENRRYKFEFVAFETILGRYVHEIALKIDGARIELPDLEYITIHLAWFLFEIEVRQSNVMTNLVLQEYA